MTFQNYKGFDLGALETILGSSEYANLKTAEPAERDSSGNPSSSVSSPQYTIDYAFKHHLIKLAYFTSTIDSYYFSNSLDKLSFDTLTITNVTHYYPGTATAVILEAQTDVTNLTIANINIDGLDMIYGTRPMIHIEPYITLIVSGGTISNVNKNAYDLDTTNFSYISQNGVVFAVYPITINTSYDPFDYTFRDLVIDKVYGYRGGAFYFNEEAEVTTAHNCTITISNVTIQNSHIMKTTLIHFSSLFLFLFTFTINAEEIEVEDPGKIVKETVDQVLLVLQDASLDELKRKELITSLIEPRINFQDMARRILATNWKVATEAQQKDFTALFKQILINTYWIRMNQYTGERVEYISVSSNREGYATVDTIIVRDKSNVEIPLSYRMKRFVDVWYAYDFVVETLSLVQSYRNEYNATIKNYGIDGLLDLLKQEVESYDA